jgi:hypothetical protein
MMDVNDDEVLFDSDGNQIRNDAMDTFDNVNDVIIDDDSSTTSNVNGQELLFEDNDGPEDDAVTGNNDDELFCDDDEEEVCPFYASSPCEWIELGDAVVYQSDT